jgi:hypothetical protein
MSIAPVIFTALGRMRHAYAAAAPIAMKAYG